MPQQQLPLLLGHHACHGSATIHRQLAAFLKMLDTVSYVAAQELEWDFRVTHRYRSYWEIEEVILYLNLRRHPRTNPSSPP